jgi:hypothetical protein
MTAAVLSKLVTSELAPSMKARGFAKERLTFVRQHGETLQAVELQVASGGREHYVNVGVAFDEFAALHAKRTVQWTVGKHTVDFTARLEELVAKLPDRWSTSALDPSVLAGIERAMKTLDAVRDARSGLAKLRLGKGFWKVLRAQLKWVCGDVDGAHADIDAVAEEFADRRGCTRRELAARAGLPAW